MYVIYSFFQDSSETKFSFNAVKSSVQCEIVQIIGPDTRCGEPMACVPNISRWPNFNGTRKILKNCTKKFFSFYKMLLVRNSNKQIIYVLKMTIFLMISNFSSNYVHESLFAIKNVNKSKEWKVLTNETIAACVSLRLTKI
jgi:hypothetical protein